MGCPPLPSRDLVPIRNGNMTADTDANRDDNLTFYTDDDTLRNPMPRHFPDSQSYDIALNIHSKHAAHAAGASQNTHNLSREHALINVLIYELHRERALARTREVATSGSSAASSNNSLILATLHDLGNVIDTKRSHHQSERRRIDSGNPFVADLPNPLSSSTRVTARSSLVSTDATPLPIYSASSTPLPTDSTEAYECPVCNMGEGRAQRPYTRRTEVVASGSALGESPDTIREAGLRPMKRLSTFKVATWFNKHFKECHLELFRRFNSAEFFCLLCPCDTVMLQLCRANFADVEKLLEHLRQAHSRQGEERKRHDHICFP